MHFCKLCLIRPTLQKGQYGAVFSEVLLDGHMFAGLSWISPGFSIAKEDLQNLYIEIRVVKIFLR